MPSRIDGDGSAVQAPRENELPAPSGAIELEVLASEQDTVETARHGFHYNGASPEDAYLYTGYIISGPLEVLRR